jgi:regulator of RNase E activity RraA
MHGFGVVDPAIRPLCTPIKRAIGPALTMKVHRGDNLVARKGMNLVKSGDVMLIDSRGDVTKAVLGGVSTEEMARRGLEAIIVDGAVRDRAHITRLGLPVFARAVRPAPSAARGSTTRWAGHRRRRPTFHRHGDFARDHRRLLQR